MRKWILAKFVATEMLILSARIVNRIRKSWFSSYGQVGSSGEKGGMHKFLLRFNMKVSVGGAAAYLDFIVQKISYPPGSFSSIVLVTF